MKNAVIGRPQAPSTHAHLALRPCSRACCWTPYVCAKARNCECHTGERDE